MLQEVNELLRKIINGDRVDLSRKKTTTTCYVERYTKHETSLEPEYQAL